MPWWFISSIFNFFCSLLCRISFLLLYYRLFIITTSPAHLIPSSIAAYTNVIEFSQSRDGLADRFLYRFIKLEKPRIHDTLYQVAQVPFKAHDLRDAKIWEKFQSSSIFVATGIDWCILFSQWHCYHVLWTHLCPHTTLTFCFSTILQFPCVLSWPNQCIVVAIKCVS